LDVGGEHDENSLDGRIYILLWQLSYLEKTLLCEGPLGEIWKKDWKKTEGRLFVMCRTDCSRRDKYQSIAR
jgi:hypothetical protein